MKTVHVLLIITIIIGAYSCEKGATKNSTLTENGDTIKKNDTTKQVNYSDEYLAVFEIFNDSIVQNAISSKDGLNIAKTLYESSNYSITIKNKYFAPSYVADTVNASKVWQTLKKLWYHIVNRCL